MGKNKHIQQQKKRQPIFPIPSNTETDQKENQVQPQSKTSKQIVKPKNGSTKNKELLDEYQVENIILRITLPQAVKVLSPVAAFVICNHACKWS